MGIFTACLLPPDMSEMYQSSEWKDKALEIPGLSSSKPIHIAPHYQSHWRVGGTMAVYLLIVLQCLLRLSISRLPLTQVSVP